MVWQGRVDRIIDEPPWRNAALTGDSHNGISHRTAAEHNITHFVALPFDVTNVGLVPGEPFKCVSPAAAIARAQELWKIFGHAGAVAFIRTGYPVTGTTVLRRFGNVPDDLPN